MYAAVVTVRIDPEQASAAAATFMSEVLPGIRSAAGFTAGYWLEPADGRGISMILFETEEQARAAAPPAGWTAPGVTVESVEVGRVAVAVP